MVVAIRKSLVLVFVTGSSMEPTLKDGDRILVLRRHWRLTSGQIVVIRNPLSKKRKRAGIPENDSIWLVKRLAACPGDPIPVSVLPVAENLEAVPPGSVVVLGDSPSSADSREWGLFPIADVLGVALVRLPLRAVSRRTSSTMAADPDHRPRDAALIGREGWRPRGYAGARVRVVPTSRAAMAPSPWANREDGQPGFLGGVGHVV
jgi:signal peptidase I